MILREQGHDPSPKRGFVDLHFFVCIQFQTRRAFIAPNTGRARRSAVSRSLLRELAAVPCMTVKHLPVFG